jgi:formate dehydrogenase major subunit
MTTPKRPDGLSPGNGNGRWPVLHQIRNRDAQGLGASATSAATAGLRPRTESADRVVRSVCPYCAVGCGQLVYVQDGAITNIEGDPESPISEGCLCPKGAATFQLVTGSHRLDRVLYRRPGGRAWEALPLERAMDMVAERVRRARDATWEETAGDDGGSDGNGQGGDNAGQRPTVNRTLGIAHLGGATLDNEENYLLKKLYTALGIVQVENQARI